MNTDKIYIVVVSCILILLIVYEYYRNPFTFTIDYKKEIYPLDVFTEISDLCKSIRTEEMKLEENKQRRLMYVFKEDDPKFAKLKPLLFSNTLIEYVRSVTGKRLEPCLKIPVEYRKYIEGSHMMWHSDTKMLKRQYQYECVLTLENTTDSVTRVHKLLYIQDIRSEPNSLMITRAHGPLHRVTPVTQGERSILKFVFYDPTIDEGS